MREPSTGYTGSSYVAKTMMITLTKMGLCGNLARCTLYTVQSGIKKCPKKCPDKSDPKSVPKMCNQEDVDAAADDDDAADNDDDEANVIVMMMKML